MDDHVARQLAFGAALRAVRLSLGLSQDALAAASDLDRTYVSGIERGRRNPTLQTIWRIATALQVKPSHLMLRAEEQQ